MAIPTRKKWLAELAKTSYHERNKRIFELARGEAQHPGWAQLVRQLDKGDLYERTIALRMAIAAGDVPFVIDCLHSGSRLLSSLAAHAVAQLASDDTIVGVIDDLSAALRATVLQQVRRKKRKTAAARLLPQLLAQHDRAAAVHLLHLCPQQEVRRLLPELSREIGNWKMLAKCWPLLTLNHLRECLSGAPERERNLVWQRFAGAIPYLCREQPAQMVELVRDFLPDNEVLSPWWACFAGIVRASPDKVFELLTTTRLKNGFVAGQLPDVVFQCARRLAGHQLVALGRLLQDTPLRLAMLLREMAPARRVALFDEIFQGVDTARRAWPEELLAVLPHQLRDREASRMLGLREIQAEPERLLQVTAFCHLDKVREELCARAKASQAEQRAQALSCLVECCGRYRTGLDETLRHLERIKNDQDPVRSKVFAALASLPIVMFAEAHVERLMALAQCVFEARDTSEQTRTALQTLAKRLLLAHAGNPSGKIFQSALELLKKLAAQTGTLALPPLEHNLPKGMEHKIVEVLLPQIEAGVRREDYQLLIGLASSLGKRVWYVEPFQELLGKVALRVDMPASSASGQDEVFAAWWANATLDLWLAPPKTRDRRINELLQRDRSAIAVGRVFQHLHWRRQDLLDDFVDGTPISGRFLSGRTVYLLPAVDGFHRWLPHQQEAFAALLTRVAQDAARSSHERARAIRTLARIPVCDGDRLAAFLQDADVNIVEATLAALAWTDQPTQTLPLLLQYVDGERARVAMYAVPRSARFLTRQGLEESLLPLLQKTKLKVTVHKEIVRLIGALRLDPELSILRAEWDKPELHKDVRIAVLHAARTMLQQPAAWQILQQATAMPEADVALALLAPQSHAWNADHKRCYAGLIAALATHPDLRVRKACFASLPTWSEGCEDVLAQVCVGPVVDVERGMEWRESATALVQICQDGAAGKVLLETVATLAATAEQPIGDGQRDLPARQRLLAIVHSLARLKVSQRLRLRDSFLLLQQVLESRFGWWHATALLRLARLSWDEERATGEALQRLAMDAAPSPFYLAALPDLVANYLTQTTREWQPQPLVQIIAYLAQDPACEVQWLALAMLKVVASRLSWDARCIALLKQLRQSPHAGIREEALRVFYARE